MCFLIFCWFFFAFESNAQDTGTLNSSLFSLKKDYLSMINIILQCWPCGCELYMVCWSSASSVKWLQTLDKSKPLLFHCKLWSHHKVWNTVNLLFWYISLLKVSCTLHIKLFCRVFFLLCKRSFVVMYIYDKGKFFLLAIIFIF